MRYTILIGGYNQSHFGGIQEVVLRGDGSLEGLTGINGPMNPSFLAWQDPRLFSVNETPEGAELCLLNYDGAGTSVRSRAPFIGRGLCHVGISPDARLAGGACSPPRTAGTSIWRIWAGTAWTASTAPAPTPWKTAACSWAPATAPGSCSSIRRCPWPGSSPSIQTSSTPFPGTPPTAP